MKSKGILSQDDDEDLSKQLVSDEFDPDKYDPDKSLNTLPYSRTLTFTRALTFDTSAMKRNLSVTFGFDIDSDEAWTKNLLDTYYLAANTGVEGDIPIPADFARNREFWKAFVIAVFMGGFIGVAALGFLNFADRVRKFIKVACFIHMHALNQRYRECGRTTSPPTLTTTTSPAEATATPSMAARAAST